MFGKGTKKKLNKNTILVSRIQSLKTNVAGPGDEDDIIGCSEQIQLTNMRASGAPKRSQGAPLARIFVSWICGELPIMGICQLVLQH